MNVNDRVKIKDVGSKTFNHRSGTVMKSAAPDYDWFILLDGTINPDDSYGFMESELELIE